MVATVAIAALLALAPAAGAAGTVTLTVGKGGTNADGSCATVVGTGTNQVWQFNLTGIASGGDNALLTASFSIGGGVSGISPDVVNGGVAKWFVQTPSGAKLLSASADGTNVTFGRGASQLVVSDCTRSGGGGPS
jgi:hypothetical protein